MPCADLVNWVILFLRVFVIFFRAFSLTVQFSYDEVVFFPPVVFGCVFSTLLLVWSVRFCLAVATMAACSLTLTLIYLLIRSFVPSILNWCSLTLCIGLHTQSGICFRFPFLLRAVFLFEFCVFFFLCLTLFLSLSSLPSSLYLCVLCLLLA